MKDSGYEKGENQMFLLELLHNEHGVDNPYDVITLENQIQHDRCRPHRAVVQGDWGQMIPESIDYLGHKYDFLLNI